MFGGLGSMLGKVKDKMAPAAPTAGGATPAAAPAPTYTQRLGRGLQEMGREAQGLPPQTQQEQQQPAGPGLIARAGSLLKPKAAAPAPAPAAPVVGSEGMLG